MRSLFIVSLCATLFTACDKIENLDNFDIEVTDEVVLEGGGALEVLLGGFPQLDGFTALDLSQTAEFEERDYSPDDVDSIRLDALVMTVLDPEGQDLSFLGTVVVTLHNDALPDLEIARQEVFPDGEGRVAFETSDANLERYLLGTRSAITIDVEDSRRPPQNTRVEVKAIFDVDVNVI